VFRFDLVVALRYVIAEVAHSNETSLPNYNLYLLADVREFVIGMGIVQLAVALVVVGRLNFRRLVRGPTAEVFSTGVFCTLVVLWLLGINRGEVTRLWIFLAVFVAMVAAYGCSSRPEVLLGDLVLADSIAHIGFVLHL